MQLNKKNKLLNQLYLSKIMGYKYCEDLNIDKNELSFNLPDTINEIDNIISNCSLCSFCNLSEIKVINNIKENADILFISTFRLASKDDIFDAMLNKVLNLSRDDVNILSILKCDIDEKVNINDQVNICKEYVLKQIDIIKPKLIITLGDSYNYLLNSDVNISNIRGNMLKYNNINLIPMYHPLILLRNPSLKKDALTDLQKIKLLMENF
ncbi:MAG TPA: hypothetical protein EYG97_00850 [Arcobacter sp.]|nr:hypothetical protein [Arcobacter sp.]HIP55552.1 hypothetical protein [Arcobacter sp.]